MRSKRPYQKTDPPREWARKKILDLEEAVAALKTRADEQGEVVKALLDQRSSRFSQSSLSSDFSPSSDMVSFTEDDLRKTQLWETGDTGSWVALDGRRLGPGSVLVPQSGQEYDPYAEVVPGVLVLKPRVREPREPG